MKCEIKGLKSEIWNLQSKVWNRRSEIRNVNYELWILEFVIQNHSHFFEYQCFLCNSLKIEATLYMCSMKVSVIIHLYRFSHHSQYITSPDADNINTEHSHINLLNYFPQKIIWWIDSKVTVQRNMLGYTFVKMRLTAAIQRCDGNHTSFAQHLLKKMMGGNQLSSFICDTYWTCI